MNYTIVIETNNTVCGHLHAVDKIHFNTAILQ